MLNARAGSASPVLGWPAEFGLGLRLLVLVYCSWSWATGLGLLLLILGYPTGLGLDRWA